MTNGLLTKIDRLRWRNPQRSRRERAKQKYEKPAMQVYELRGQTRLLVGSDGTEDYNRNTPQNW